VIAQAQGGNAQLLISLLLMVAIFYFLLIRPQQRRMRQQRSLIADLDVGDEVITIGGIIGTVASVEEDWFEVEISAGTRIRLLKSAVARKVPEDVPETEDEEADESK
jgi:preprotein translocase subunit YajC